MNNRDAYVIMCENRTSARCEVEVFVHTKSIGTWLINKNSFERITHPSEGGEELCFRVPESGEVHELGLITAVFYPPIPGETLYQRAPDAALTLHLRIVLVGTLPLTFARETPIPPLLCSD